jgi:hypothetical protein
MTQPHRLRAILVALAAVVALGAATDANAQRLRPGPVKISARDKVRLDRLATTFEGHIRGKHTPVVDIHITEASQNAGVRFTKTSDPRYIGATPAGHTTFELRGVAAAGGEVELVLSGGASGHVQQPTYGGRPFSVVQAYGRDDTIHLTQRSTGASRSSSLIRTQSRGLVTQEGFKAKLVKGENNFYYFRTASRESSGGEGSEPELRQVTFKVLD